MALAARPLRAFEAGLLSGEDSGARLLLGGLAALACPGNTLRCFVFGVASACSEDRQIGRAHV